MAEQTLEQIKAQIADCIAKGDDAGMMEAIKQLNKMKAEITKAAQEQARKEAEALAGAREKLATSIYKAVRQIPDVLNQLTAVKATGFTFKLDTEEIQYKSVALAVPAVKQSRGGGGGKSTAEYGVSLSDIFDRFATDEDKAKLKAAESNSAQWSIKNAVKKRAIAEGKLQPVK